MDLLFLRKIQKIKNKNQRKTPQNLKKAYMIKAKIQKFHLNLR